LTRGKAIQLDRSEYAHMVVQEYNAKDQKVDIPKPFDRVLLRQRLSNDTAREFNEFVSRSTQSRSKRGSRELSNPEKRAGFQLGTMFFYGDQKGTDDSFRIRNMINHENRDIRLTREIPGANWLIQAAQTIVEKAADSTANSVTLPSAGIRLSEGELYKKMTEDAPTKVMERIRTLDASMTGSSATAKKWTDMTPEGAVRFLRGQKIDPRETLDGTNYWNILGDYDDRWKITKAVSKKLAKLL